MARRRECHHRGPVDWSVPVLVAAALTLAIVTSFILVGGVFGGESSSPTVATAPGSPPPQRRYAIEVMQNAVVVYQHLIWRNARIARLDYYLSGSPMAGLGELMQLHGERTGVNSYLCAAVATAESATGRQNCGSFNPFGMLGESYGSWEESIERWFTNCDKNWPDAQNGYDLEQPPLYCETNVEEYARNVTSVVDAIGRIEL